MPGVAGIVEADGSLPPRIIPRLKKGIERFMITDIKNPAAGAWAQSTIPVMWDAWGDSNNVIKENTVILVYDHIPEGSNVLYMDGHVEWIKHGTKYPVANEPPFTGGTGYNQGQELTRSLDAIGGFG